MGETPTHSAYFALRLSAAPPPSPETAQDMSEFLSCVWPVLTKGDAIESRFLAADGAVETLLLLRSERGSASEASDAASRLRKSLLALAGSTLPSWAWQEVPDDLVSGCRKAFRIADGGDLIRREIAVAFAGADPIDVSAIMASEDRDLSPLLESMAAAPADTMLTITLQPARMDGAEQQILIGELRELVSDGRYSNRTSPLAARLAGEALSERLAAPGGLGQLRMTIASSAPLTDDLVALALVALDKHPTGLQFVRPINAADKKAFRANLRDLGFALWGPLAETEAGRADISDSYLASFDEIVAAWRIPQPDGFDPLGAMLRDPAPKPVPLEVPRTGLIVGTSLYGSAPRDVALSEEDRARHMYVVGQTGAGKSTLLVNMIMQDIEAGRGLAVVDPHGDLVDDIMARFPADRAEDLILVDPSDIERPVGMNILESGAPGEQDFLVQAMIEMLYRIYDPGHTGIIGPRFEHWFRNGALTAMALPGGGSLLDIPKLFTDDRFLAEALQHVADPPIRSFWIDELGQTSDFHKSEVLGWFTAKFGAFTANRMMRDVVGQRESSFSFGDAMDEGKVVLVRLSKGQLGEVNLRWLGMIAVAKIQLAAMRRSEVPRDERRPFGLYVDEFQNFSLGSFDQMIAEARKYGLQLTLANQHVEQLPEDFRAAIFGNVGAIAAFRLGAKDAEIIAAELTGYSARDLTRIENFRCVLRLAVGGRVQPPFDVYTAPSPAPEDADLAADIRQLARLKYGRPSAEVEAEVLQAYAPLPRRVAESPET